MVGRRSAARYIPERILFAVAACQTGSIAIVHPSTLARKFTLHGFPLQSNESPKRIIRIFIDFAASSHYYSTNKINMFSERYLGVEVTVWSDDWSL